MASLVGAVLGAAVGSAAKTAADIGVNFIQKKLKLWAEFEVDIGEFKRDLELKLAKREQQLLQEVTNPEQKISFEHTVDLAYDIEDFLDRIQRCRVDWFKLSAKVKELKTRLEKEKEHQGKQNNNGNPSQSTTTSLTQANASSSTSPQPIKLVGIDKPTKEILDLLNDIDGQQEQTTKKVICIVGFSGTGKSKLAEEVYKCTDLVSRFPCRAWVIASRYKDNTDGLRMALIKQINSQETDHAKNITDHLINKRNAGAIPC